EPVVEFADLDDAAAVRVDHGAAVVGELLADRHGHRRGLRAGDSGRQAGREDEGDRGERRPHARTRHRRLPRSDVLYASHYGRRVMTVNGSPGRDDSDPQLKVDRISTVGRVWPEYPCLSDRYRSF